MIAYLEKYDTTVDLPDDIGQKDLADVNENFPHYVEPKTQTEQPNNQQVKKTSEPQTPEQQATPDRKWIPNFYQSVVKPMLPAITPGIPLGDIYSEAGSALTELPGAKAFEGKAIEQGTFGLAKPLTDQLFAQDYKDHPAYAMAGELAGGVGSLLAAGGAIRALGAGAATASAGSAAVEAGFAAGERFIPRAIMSGATFGTRTFIAETVKAFEDHQVNLEQFGKDVLKDTAFGGILGTIGGVESVAASVSSAAGLGFISSKMEGADNREASLHAAIWAAFETVGSFGKTTALRMEALGNLKESIGEYIGERNPGLADKDASRAAGEFVDNSIRKAGFDGPEDIAKSGPENLLKAIEDINQQVRGARIPAEPPAEGVGLPKLPAPIQPETTPTTAIVTPPVAPQTPFDKAVDFFKDLFGVPKETPRTAIETPKEEPKKLEPDEDHFQNAAATKQDVTKAATEITGRLSEFGIKPEEQSAIFDTYGVGKTGQLGQPMQVQDLIKQPIEDQYKQVYDSLAEQRGITGERINAKTMDDAEKSVDLINGYFNPQSQEIQEFTKAHQDLSDHNVAQMAYDRGILEEPNPDLLKAEIEKAKQEKISGPKIEASISPGATMNRPTLPIAEEIASHIKGSASEISSIVNPTNAAPLAAQITREQLGKMARSYDMAEAALEEAHGLFDKQSKENNIQFIDNLERGLPQGDPKLQGIADTLRKLLDDKRKEIASLGTGKLKAFIENYFPHIWDQGEKEVGQTVQKAAKRPFEGQKSFLKKRSIEFTKDGIDMGLTPVSYNPVDLALLKIREMDKYLMAHRTIQEYKKNGLAKYVKVGGDVPEGWQKIDDRISTVFKSPMVAVKEAYDEKLMSDLNDVAMSLGIKIDRNTRMEVEGRKFNDAWGLSQSSETGKPGKIQTRFAGPESALAHEIGHQVDNIYGLQKKFLSDPEIENELGMLAEERLPDNPSAKFEEYVNSPEELMAVMFESYVHAPELFRETAPKTYAKLQKFLNANEKLKPITEIKPGLLMGVNESQVYAGGNVISGNIYAQPDAARIINNYLSPGLQKSPIYQAYRYAGNLINQFQLGMSAFHLGFTSLDAAVSKFALAIMELDRGNPLSAIKNTLATPFAPVTNIIRGDALLKAWRGEGQAGLDPIIAEAMAMGGGRARMDQFYATSAYEQMKHHFEAGRYVRGILNIPMALADISSKPILEYIVPRQKLGVFADMMQMELKNDPNMTNERMREIAQRAWDSVDNRMGQMVYDNLFWNRTFKDLLMGTMRSTGWNVGTARELLGGTKDLGEYILNAAKGDKTEMTNKNAYIIALPFLVGLLGAITCYLRTGKGPKELKDYYYPPTGGVDEHGDPHRMALPSYMKDVYSYTQHPVRTVTNKLSPLISMVAQMLENKDYYGTKIANEDDPAVRQVASEVAFMLKQMTPFSIRNMQKNLETQNKSLLDTIGPWVGITPAPYDIDQTKAEIKAHDILASHQQIGGRTEEQMERSRLISDLMRQYRRGDPKATDNLFTAYQSGLISHRQMQNVIINANLTPLQRMVKGMTLEETEQVYAKSNDEEKAQIERYLDRKKASRGAQFVQQSSE